jgi:thioredoxin 1
MHGMYQQPDLSRAEIDSLHGPSVIEFGASWCGYCIAGRPLLERVLAAYPQIRHIKIEDGPGRPLGRSFRVKQWPTLILISDGRELARLVRPSGAEEIRQALCRVPDTV